MGQTEISLTFPFPLLGIVAGHGGLGGGLPLLVSVVVQLGCVLLVGPADLRLQN